ncbi:MAG TPA: LuxR family transcriptional regulator, partial [Thermomicrobiales bacterium]|nr:LuxR family transcriptional regulator [Thermomicrobiales bacterium]
AGDLVLARDHAARALACATAPRQPLALLAAHRALGDLATAAGRHADAATHLDAALALADACAAPYERALTLLALAELRDAAGERDAAGAALAEARAVCAELGAAPALARAAALAERVAAAAAADPRPPTAPAAPPGRLSRREAEVLRRLAGGQSTHDIARALSLSPRTVQRHVANLYLKIGAHNRAEATAFALRQGLA